jgi:phosphoglycerate dehydrogenase-like enzyme
MEKEKRQPVEVLMTIPFSEQEIQLLREVSPRLRINTVTNRDPREIPADLWSRTEVLYTDRLLPEPEQAPALRWIQFHFAGIDFAADHPLLQKPNLAATTLSGAASPQMAEYALTMLLALGHHLPEMAAAQSRGDWPRDRWDRFRPIELRGSTVGIIGYGSIGREIARLLRAFGAIVLATKRDVMHPEDAGYTIPGLGDPGGDLFHRLYPHQAARSMLRECDFVIVVAPLTPETRGMIGAAELAVMKPSAYLISMARGGIVDQSALAAALQERRIAGAVMDVFTEEPLPQTSPLWKLPNLIITPHIGGLSAQYNARAVDMFTENLKRYLTGAPLLNRFDPQRGY